MGHCRRWALALIDLWAVQRAQPRVPLEESLGCKYNSVFAAHTRQTHWHGREWWRKIIWIKAEKRNLPFSVTLQSFLDAFSVCFLLYNKKPGMLFYLFKLCYILAQTNLPTTTQKDIHPSIFNYLSYSGLEEGLEPTPWLMVFLCLPCLTLHHLVHATVRFVFTWKKRNTYLSVSTAVVSCALTAGIKRSDCVMTLRWWGYTGVLRGTTHPGHVTNPLQG